MTSDSTEIILVRHGQTEWNRIERFRGRADIPLNETGLAQARAVAEALVKRSNPAAIYASPLGRCIQTAEPIAAKTGLEIQPLAGIIDIDYGDWQGFTPAEVEERYPDLHHAWMKAPQTVTIPHGESLDQVRARAFSALEDAAKRHLGQSIVLVSHKVICKVLTCAVLGLDNSHFWRIEQDNGAMNIFEWRNGVYTVKLVNDTCHVAGVV
jgi:broad specificity phosphatase PhoE